MSLSTKWSWIVQDFPEGSDARTMMGEYEARIAELETDLREVRAVEEAQRELANANMFLVKRQAERIAELERERDGISCQQMDDEAWRRHYYEENVRLREALEKIRDNVNGANDGCASEMIAEIALQSRQDTQEADPMQNKNPLAALRGWPTEKYSALVPEPVEPVIKHPHAGDYARCNYPYFICPKCRASAYQCPKPGHRMHEGNCVTCYTEQTEEGP